MNSEVKEFSNALVTIKGNALRCGDSIYSIHNIVSLNFGSFKKEDGVEIFQVGYCELIIKYFLFMVLVGICSLFVMVFLVDGLGLRYKFINFNNDYIFLLWIIIIFIIFNIKMFLYIKEQRKVRRIHRYEWIDGLKIIFVNNFQLLLVSNTNTGFIKQAIDHLYLFISNTDYSNKKELIINFSDSSINIKEAVGSNIIGGNVQGDVKNG